MMKTLTLLVCICALSACFSLSEGRKKPWKTHHKKNNVQQLTLDRQLLLHPKFQPHWNTLIKKHLIFGPHKYPKPSHPNRRKPKPKYPQPSKCPTKNNTVVNNNNSGATTQIPSLSPTSPSNKIPTSPGVTPLILNATTISAKQNDTSSSAATPSPQPSPALSDTTAAPPTSPPALPEITAAPPTSPPAPPETTAAPPASPPAPPETTAAPPTTSPPTPAPEHSSVPLDNTADQNTTPNPSPTSPAPETSKTTTVPTIQTTSPATGATTRNVIDEQPTSPSSQNKNSQFWQYIYEIIKYLVGATPKK